jgi:hypothetical protein
MSAMLDEIVKAAYAVIRAEWQFRCGPNAYKGKTQRWFEDAMEHLRLVSTTYSELGRAGKSLGCGMKKVKRVRLNKD